MFLFVKYYFFTFYFFFNFIAVFIFYYFFKFYFYSPQRFPEKHPRKKQSFIPSDSQVLLQTSSE